MNSTGTPALFMHAADAIHGDLGMIQSGDSVICISKSGDTPEIKVLVPLIKRLGVSLIAMVSNKQSYLGQQADFVLHALAEKEADLMNLAPTTSTTVALALVSPELLPFVVRLALARCFRLSVDTGA